MPFIVQQSYMVLITEVTEDEASAMATYIEEELQLMDEMVLFPSRKGPDHATMLLQAGMGCGGSRWFKDYLPEIQRLFPGRIIHTGKWSEE